MLIPLFAGTQSLPDFKHRHVSREVKKAFGTDQYSLTELSRNTETHNYAEIRLNEKLMGYAYLNRVRSCRAGSCPVPDKNSSEYFDYLILFDQKGEVKTVRVINYAATHGQQIASTGWLRQFSGFNGGETKQLGKNVDAIAGATISANAITEDINRATQILSEKIRK